MDPDAGEKMKNFLLNSGYRFPTDPNDISTISKAAAVASLGNVAIHQLGSQGTEPIEIITLKNPWVKSVKFGDLSYDSDDLVNIELEIRYDFFTYEKGAAASRANAFFDAI